ncbi:hypothetical protein [Streptomyces sp. NBC_00827]|uniref:hypothetical protein n=1 Tax=Streptomyces sp. NBC_00827 TaxID=2903677 RepID=UPI00386DD657|nr:hypothetical protein OG569_36205 [Streptomyces sp. NBC_00827]
MCTGSASANRPCSWTGLSPRHYEADTVVRRGHVTKQDSKLVRWAVVEAIQRKTARKITEDRAESEVPRGQSTAKIAATRRLLTLIYYEPRDGEIRVLPPPREHLGRGRRAVGPLPAPCTAGRGFD